MPTEVRRVNEASQTLHFGRLMACLLLALACVLMGWLCWDMALERFGNTATPAVRLENDVVKFFNEQGTVTIANNSDVTVRIVGYERSCSCISTAEHFPIDLSPHEKRGVPFTVDGKKGMHSGTDIGTIVFLLIVVLGNLWQDWLWVINKCHFVLCWSPDIHPLFLKKEES